MPPLPWTLPTQRRGTAGHHHHHAVVWTTQNGIMRNGNWELARRSGDIVHGTVNIDVATEPSTRLSTSSGMAYQRPNRGIQSIPNWSIRLITIVHGTNVVKLFVTCLGHGRAPDNTHLLHQSTLAGATLPRSRRRLAPTAMVSSSKGS